MASPDESDFYCDICGQMMLEFNCELICLICGYRRDCTDP